ncbi:MAG: hypothetical protein R2706_03910 [Acidimicrobiales bacterium]
MAPADCRDEVDLLAVGQRGRFTGRTSDDNTIIAVLNEIAGELLGPVEG